MARNNVENNETETKVKAAKYEIEWPPQLDDIKPLMVVPVSATRSAHVYHDRELHTPNVGEHFTEEGYRIRFVLNKTGAPPQNDDHYSRYGSYRGDAAFYSNLLAVKMAIQDYSIACQPKTKTVTQKVKVEVGGDDEE